MMPTRLFALFVPIAILAACGGQSFSEGEAGAGGDDDGGGGGKSGSSSSGGNATGGRAGDGAGGTGTAGTGTAGTGSGGTGTAGTGTAGTGTAGTGCCLAFPTCGPGEYAVPDPSYCPPGGACHEVTACCSAIWCASAPQCNAYPICDPGDTTLMGACPPEALNTCYTRTLCGSTVYCLDQPEKCNPDTEYNRVYVASDCSTIDWAGCTTPNTKEFENECGCGCEQDPLCPLNLGCYGPPPPLPEGDRAPADPIPGTGGSSSGAAPNPGTGGTAAVPLPPPDCTADQLAQCPFSEYYIR